MIITEQFLSKETLRSAALKLLRRDGFNWQQANGWAFWTVDGETIAEKLDQKLSTNEDQ